MSDLRRRRAEAQLLGGRTAATPTDAVRHLLAVQAQDLRAARLALRARVGAHPAITSASRDDSSTTVVDESSLDAPGGGGGGGAGARVTAADVDRLIDDGKLVVGWLLRGTLHLVAREDYGWLHGLTAPGRASAHRRRLAQEGVASEQAERAVDVVRRALEDEGPLTRSQLGDRLADAGVPTAGQALPHLLGLAAMHGVAVLGPLRDDGHAFSSTAAWLGDTPPTRLEGAERADALAQLARRYLTGHGPATAADLAAWSGLPLRDVRAGLAAIDDHVTSAGPDGLLALRPLRHAPGPAPPRLLPAFDPYLLGWKDRAFAVELRDRQAVHPGGGMIRATAIVDGQVAATWKRDRDGGIELEPLRLIPRRDRRALDREIEDVRRFEASGRALGSSADAERAP